MQNLYLIYINHVSVSHVFTDYISFDPPCKCQGFQSSAVYPVYPSQTTLPAVQTLRISSGRGALVDRASPATDLLGTNNGHTPHRDKRGILILSSTWLFLARILLMEALFTNSRNGSLQLTNLPAVAQAEKSCSRHVFPYQNYNYNNFSPPEHVKSWGWSGRPKRFASSSKKPFLEVLHFSSHLLHKVTNAPWGAFLVVIIETYVILWLNVQRFSTLLTYKGLNKCFTFFNLSNAFFITVYMLFNKKNPNYWVKQQKMNRTI